MSECPFCDKPESPPPHTNCGRMVWWICGTYQCSPVHQPHQSPECEAYVEGREAGRSELREEAQRIASESANGASVLRYEISLLLGEVDWLRNEHRVLREENGILIRRLANAVHAARSWRTTAREFEAQVDGWHEYCVELRAWQIKWESVIEAVLKAINRNRRIWRIEVAKIDAIMDSVRKAEEGR